jgi:predicted nucleotidyltransferase
MQVTEYRVILEGKMGSHSYGTSTPTSDLDTMGIVIPQPVNDYYLGLKTFGSSDTMDIKNEVLDAHFYEIRKFIHLALKTNANVLPLLYLRPQDYLRTSVSGNYLISNRDMFMSKKVYHTFCGYAAAQQKRMLGVTTGQLGQKRKDLIAAYGYDTKFAFHTVRLLKMCKEALETGTLKVYRENDRDFLLSIRNGKYTIAEILDLVKDLEADCDAAFEITYLPDEPAYEQVHDMVVSIVETFITQ